MLKSLLILLLLFVGASAKELQPLKTFEVHGGINDAVFKDGKIYVATASGKVDIVDFKSGKIIKEISLTKITDFMGDPIDSEVFSVDVVGEKILILSQDLNGYTRLDIYENGKLRHIFDKEEKLYVVKAKFIDEKRVLLGQLSNVYTLYDITSKKHLWDVQATMSKFSNFALNDDRREVATADESGDLNLLSVKDGKKLRHYKGVNKDEVFGIDWKKHLIITGGKDKKIGLYDDSSQKSSSLSYNFFIYSVALSQDAKLAAASVDDKNNVVIFDTATKTERYRLVGNSSKIAVIIFVNDKEVLVASNDNRINLYRLH